MAFRLFRPGKKNPGLIVIEDYPEMPFHSPTGPLEKNPAWLNFGSDFDWGLGLTNPASLATNHNHNPQSLRLFVDKLLTAIRLNY
jgi:hypothetical protein